MTGKAQRNASRRSFLKTSALAAVGAAMGAEGQASASDSNTGTTAQITTARKPSQGLADLVNLLQGTDSTGEFSRGNTLPIAALPFGMAHWTLQSRADSPWMFQPRDRRVHGLRCTHQLSPWLGDYGHATFLPFCGEIKLDAGSRASSYRPEDAHLRPYSLELFLLRYRAHVELVPTERCAVIAASFEESVSTEVPGFLIDIPGKTGVVEPDANRRSIRFTSTANTGGVPENFATYYIVSFAEACASFEWKTVGNHRVGVARFERGRPVEARIATSFISFEQAELNLAQELGTKPISALRKAAAARWNEHLNRIEIEGATLDQQRTFYSCLYRTLLFPRVFHEPDATGAMHHFSAFSGKVEPGVMYADHGYWDVYRAWYPLMSILFPERLGEILQAWVNAYKEGGWMPQFPSPGYRACMTGSLIDAAFGDAAAKGIAGFDLAAAYEGLKKHATAAGDPDRGYGRVGLELYLKHRFVPANRIEQSVAETVDAAYGDFCIAQVAKALGKLDDYEAFLKRSENWRNVYDSETKFFRGKNEDGKWSIPAANFDPFVWGSPYVEGSAWQHRWDAPQNLAGMIDAIGGNAAAIEALDKMMTLPPIFKVGVYEDEIHEMSEMAAVKFGQYAHSNQPSHHLLFLFAHAGRQGRTQAHVRRVMRELYTPDAFAGDEDTGSMAAWYVLNALGFYPVCPGRPEYTIGSPLFPRATVHLSGNKSLVVEATGNNAETVYVRRASLNGKPIANGLLQHAALVQGGVLRFEMSGIEVS